MKSLQESTPNIDHVINEIKDQFSISLQYYYELSNDYKGEVHLNKCIALIMELRTNSELNEKDIQLRLAREVVSIYHTGKFSIRLV